MSDVPEDMRNRMKECPECGQKAPKGQIDGYGKCGRCYFSERDEKEDKSYRKHEDIEPNGSGTLDSGENLLDNWKEQSSDSSSKREVTA